MTKPRTADGYTSESLGEVRSLCLYVATKLGDLMDHLVIVGGLAPSLLIEQEGLDPEEQVHVGTRDLDVGLAVALLDGKRYTALTERLRSAGFSCDVNEEGNPTRQRWKLAGVGNVAIDFLIQPTQEGDEGGKLRDIEPDFAAFIIAGLNLAFEDRRKVTISDVTIMGEAASRDVWVCGAGAYVVLKALAFKGRGDNKDAYDLYYVLRNYGAGPTDVAAALRGLLDDKATEEGLDVLRKDFSRHDGLGPRRVAEFLTGGPDDAIQADVVGFVQELIRLLAEG